MDSSENDLRYPYGWVHGLLVKPFDPQKTTCSFCGGPLWGTTKELVYTRYGATKEIIMWTIGCPKYGTKFEVHDHWWRYDEPKTNELTKEEEKEEAYF